MSVKRLAAGIGLAGALFAAAAVPGASAGNPHDQTQPSASVTTLVSGPTPVNRRDIPAGTLTASTPAAAAGGCGACLATCWTATTRSGPSDWSGSVFIYQHLFWCGNGAVVTYATASQSFSQSGSYRLDSTYGPWWSGGCTGCPSLRVSGYILWSWSAPLISIPSSGTSHLDSVMYAYGGLSF